MSSLNKKIDAVEAALEKQPPFCTGLVELNEKSSTLFFKKEGNSAGFVDFRSANVEALQALTDACVPAKFGRGNEDVYDESYRKAKKMNTNDFNIAFDPSRIVQTIRSTLLDGKNQKAQLELELYQLNVYDKGSFFKAHRDTPRSRSMFASLVVVFPAAHEGGKLLLRHDEEEWIFDSAEILSKATTPSAAFVAFYSDVEHEVTPVESGHRVTITYNIYHGESGSASDSSVIRIQSNRNVDTSLFRTSIASLLQDPKCLPKGGYFGFGLRFLYPAFGGTWFNISEMLTKLKGSDAVIYNVCTSLSLETSLQILTESESGYSIFLNRPQNLDGQQVENLSWALSGVTPIYNWRTGSKDETDDDRKPARPVMWLSDSTPYVVYSSDYIAYGNEASLSNIYGHVCLAVKVGPVGKRETRGVEENSDPDDEEQEQEQEDEDEDEDEENEEEDEDDDDDDDQEE